MLTPMDSVKQSPAKRSNIRKPLLATVAGCVLAIPTAELALRALRDSKSLHPYQPNTVQITYTDPELTPGVTGFAYFTTNSYGCRGPEFAGETHRLLVIGGSTAACVALDDSEEWAHLVMTSVNATKHDPHFLWVTNSGIDGRDSRHHLMHCRFLLPALPRVDRVLIYCGLNDVGRWLYHKEFNQHELEDPGKYAEIVAESFRDSSYLPPGEPWYKALAIWKYAKHLKNRFASQRAVDLRDKGVIVEDDRMQWLKEERLRRASIRKELVPQAKLATLPIALDAYESRLRAMIDLVRKSGAEPVFMAQAIKFGEISEEERRRIWMGSVDGGQSYVQEDEMQELVDAFNKRMSSVASDSKVTFIDLPTLLHGKENLFFDGCHFTESGARAVADVVAKSLVEQVYGH